MRASRSETTNQTKTDLQAKIDRARSIAAKLVIGDTTNKLDAEVQRLMFDAAGFVAVRWFEKSAAEDDPVAGFERRVGEFGAPLQAVIAAFGSTLDDLANERTPGVFSEPCPVCKSAPCTFPFGHPVGERGT